MKTTRIDNPKLKLGCWNVRTMLPGISEDLQTISDVRKTAVINKELLRLQIDIAALQETRLADSGILKESDYTFFWQGKNPGESIQHGVGFAVHNSLLDKVQLGCVATERIMSLVVNTTTGSTNLVCVYAPTLSSPEETKDSFYNSLELVLRKLNDNHSLILLGDFNARVGADYEAWPTCLGHFGVKKCNDNGQRVLELCAYHDLCITNTFFSTKKHHSVSWWHPRSKHGHQLDLILTRRKHFCNFTLTRSYHSADCDTDHSLVCCTIKLHPKKFYRTKQTAHPKVDVTKTKDSGRINTFASSFTSQFIHTEGLSSTEMWTNLKEATHNAAMSAFGQKKRRPKE
ncbi:craniofacial development protein 2-like [Penaeus indicus]|uniref:craniofacial development protein 2-like n=1 Tax=Penaeus indicus TaxID=29960 RepID=UPI00300D3CC1